jgi:hypothetical protein
MTIGLKLSNRNLGIKVDKVAIGIALLVILLSFERVSINVGPARIRLAFLPLLILFLVLTLQGRIRFRWTTSLPFAGFAVFSLLSLPQSQNLPRSILYIGWVIVDYLAVFKLFEYFSHRCFDSTIKGILASFRIQILVAWAIVLMGINLNATQLLGRYEDVLGLGFVESFNENRAYLLYQEPSFYVFALSIYVGIVVSRILKYGLWQSLFDAAILFIAIYSTKSATLGFIILFAAFVSFITKITLKKIYTLTAFGAISLVIGLVIATSQPYNVNDQYSGVRPLRADTLVVDTLQGILLSGDPVTYLQFRSGGRLVMMDCQIDAFIKYPLTGVGIGAYSEYTQLTGFKHCLDNATYPLGAGALLYSNAFLPSMNIYLEMLATTGILASLCFFLFLGLVLFRCPIPSLKGYQKEYWVSLLTVLITALAQPTYLNPFIWLALGLYSGSIQSTHFVKAKQPPRHVN